MNNSQGGAILKYDKKTAGKIMTKDVPVVGIDETIGGIEKLIVKKADSLASINYVYVINRRNKLAGVASIKEVFRQKKRQKIVDIMTTELIVVRSSTDQEKVAYRALKNNLKAMPVVDKNGVFLGVVQSDDILRVLHEENEEDAWRMIGVVKPEGDFDNVMNLSVFTSFAHRFPWLFVGILGGLLIAKIIGIFEKTISSNIILIVFIPLVTYIASAVSTQMSTFIIRDLALDNGFRFWRYFFKNFMVVFLIAIFSAFSFFSLDMILYKNLHIGIILSVAIFTSIISALFTGLIIPFVLSKMKVDPANASGPFGTIMQDTLSVTIYFLVISCML
ncbi:hypothetical protein C0584_03775 [Candidatus Parcubacteria bacterium]|nr:MAG: hypothetical protein C0584_03775 [Candidatus Parcubacteria bacterium]